MKSDQKIYTFTGRLEQNNYSETKKAHLLLKIFERFTFLYSDSIKVNW